MTGNGNEGGPLNAPAVWNGRLAMACALALRELADANPHLAVRELRSTLDAYLAESGVAPEVAESLATTARLPRIEGGAA